MKTLAIDLGTYNTAAAVLLPDGSIHIVQNSSGHSSGGKSFPSYVEFDTGGNVLSVGEMAKRALRAKRQFVVWGVKRLVGLSFSQARERGLTQHFAYQLEADADDRIVIVIGPKRFSCEDILEMILRAVKADAENPDANPELRGMKFTCATITHPADYNAVRVGIIGEAARRVFDIVNTMAEPTAAAISYGLAIDEEAKVMAFDEGAGTLDVSILRLTRRNGALHPTERGVSGHEALGGIDMDRLLLEMLKVNPLFMKGREKMSDTVLVDYIEMAKIELSESATATIPGRSPFTLTRADLERALASLLPRMRNPIIHALEAAGMKAAEIDHLVMVGGPTKMPCVRRTVADMLRSLGAPDSVLEQALNPPDTVDPMECVASGAAVKPAELDSPMPEGFGIMLGESYQNMIHPGSEYPTKSAPKHLSPIVEHKRRAMTINAVMKMRDANVTALQFRYVDLGEYTLYLNPEHSADVSVHMEISAQKALTMRLIQTEFQSNQAAYSGANLLLRAPVPVATEDRKFELPPGFVKNRKTAEEAGIPIPTPPNQIWTKDQYQELILLASRVHKSVNMCVRKPQNLAAKLGELDSAVRQAANANGQWKETTWPVANRISETLRLCEGYNSLPPSDVTKFAGELAAIAA